MIITIETTPTAKTKEYDVIISFPDNTDIYATLTVSYYGYGDGDNTKYIKSVQIHNFTEIPLGITQSEIIEKIEKQYEDGKF